ncbi:ATP synthase subunit d, mitochondrial-like isoform X2 [Aricia agestis]|uniref:ATP synthase subunit d, mitochondrial-like isoform X2 n=1 Tax=Aricia agestis TaxID=91739 RepID=UPI001C205EF9|nr:ATP synthase subunit d, mitochondrial-like isoform X2 [Aricia agestis]
MAKQIIKPYFSNWANMEKLVPTEQKSKYLAFRSRYETYLRRVRSLPESPPKIDWERYKKLLPDENIVNKMKSSYEAFQVPFPEDTQTRLIEEQWTNLEPEIKAFCEDIQKDIDDDMTMEMFGDSYPDLALDSVNKPTFWPHTPQDQLGYKITEAELYSQDDK